MTLQTEPVYKKAWFIFFPLAFPPPVTSPPCYGSFAYGIPFSEARDIQSVVVTALRQQNPPNASASLTAPDHDFNVYLG